MQDWEEIQEENVSHLGWPHDDLVMIDENWIFNGRVVYHKDDLVE